MKGNRNLLQRMTESLELDVDVIPGLPLIEIAGDCRVLIENHSGVREYSSEKIGVNVKYGRILVCGCGLKLSQMTKEQLVISGRIDGVTLCRRGKG